MIDGGCVAMYRFAQMLMDSGHTLKNLTIATAKHPFDRTAYPPEMDPFDPEAVTLNTEVTATGALKHLLKGKSYNLARFVSVEFSAILKKVLTEQIFDLIICESIFLLPYLPEMRSLSRAKILVRTHNVEFSIWAGLGKHSSFPKSTYLRLLSKSLQREELQLLQQVDGILAISTEDAQVFRSYGIKVPMTVIPVTIPVSPFRNNYTCPHFHHIGSMNWQPNQDAVHHLITVLFPAIQKELPEAKLHLAGSFFPKDIVSNPEKGIVVHGFVDDPVAFMQQHGTQLVPLKSGSGVRIKLLESMSCGTPIVTTPVGARGLHPDAGSTLKIAPTDELFVKHAVDLAKNAELRRELGMTAQQFVAGHYGPETVKQLLFEFIGSIS